MGLSNFTGGNANNVPPGMGGGMASQQAPAHAGVDIEDYVIDYNKRFKMADTTLFRDEVIQQTLSVLIGKNKPNALLIGSAGVGKTKIVEDIARRLANDDPLIPDKIKDYTIYELPLSRLVSGSSYVGQVEEKTNAVVDFMSDPKNKAILFIDEIHMLVGDSQTYDKIAQILKPALARGHMRVIGATTLQESSDLANDPAFNRRFSRLIVDELSREQTIEILRNAKSGFFKHYNNKITIDDTTLGAVCILADEYKTSGSHRPDNAITLLDRTIGDAIIARKIMEIKAVNNPTMLQTIKSVPLIPITERQIKVTALRLMTGNNKKDDFDADSLTENLSVIKGQDDTTKRLVDILKRNELSLYPKTKPLTMLFAGSSGVGKTEIARIIARELTGAEPITLNMTEFNSSASINRLIGSPAGYIGSDSHAELPFDCLETNPYQIILLDEFEKCDKSVQRLFMSAFNDGYIKTNKNKIIDFSRSIIIVTTNAAHKEAKANTLGFVTQDNQTTHQDDIAELSKWFDVELLNRLGSKFMFHDLDKDIYREIMINKYQKEITRIRLERRGVVLHDTIPDADLDELIKETYVTSFGARPAELAVQKYIEDQVI